MGQGFADEVFRVFQNRYPDIDMKAVNANADVQGMIIDIRIERMAEERQLPDE